MSSTGHSPLDAEQLAALTETRALHKKLRLARGLALTNVVSLACCALLSLAFGAIALEVSAMGLVLGALAWNEERGRSLLILVDPRAPTRLALNQLLLLGVVLAYCGFRAYATWTGPDPLEALSGQSAELSAALTQLNEGAGQDISELGGWVRSAALFGYAVVAGISLLVQGWMAYYYQSLRPTVDALARAPAWTRELQ
jgi:hypothetical protein